MNYYIYIIHNSINDKKYIGQTITDINSRFIRHTNPSSVWCKKLHNAINKHGKDKFYVELLSTIFSENEANDLEIFYIQKYNSVNNGYNILSGGNIGDNFRGRHLSEDHKMKISKSQSGDKAHFWGKKHSIETKNKISQSQIGSKHHNFGKITPQEVKDKLSISNSGENSAVSKLTWDIVYQIRNEYLHEKITLKKLGEKYNVTYPNIWSIVNNKTWKLK